MDPFSKLSAELRLRLLTCPLPTLTDVLHAPHASPNLFQVRRAYEGHISKQHLGRYIPGNLLQSDLLQDIMAIVYFP